MQMRTRTRSWRRNLLQMTRPKWTPKQDSCQHSMPSQVWYIDCPYILMTDWCIGHIGSSLSGPFSLTSQGQPPCNQLSDLDPMDELLSGGHSLNSTLSTSGPAPIDKLYCMQTNYFTAPSWLCSWTVHLGLMHAFIRSLKQSAPMEMKICFAGCQGNFRQSAIFAQKLMMSCIWCGFMCTLYVCILDPTSLGIISMDHGTLVNEWVLMHLCALFITDTGDVISFHVYMNTCFSDVSLSWAHYAIIMCGATWFVLRFQNVSISSQTICIIIC